MRQRHEADARGEPQRAGETFRCLDSYPRVDERIESTMIQTPAQNQPTTKYAVKSVSGFT